MKDTILPVREAYFTALNGQLSLNGSNVPVYNDVPNNSTYPYVILSTQDSNEVTGTKACDNTEDYILIDIVTGFTSGGGGKSADLIASQVLTRVENLSFTGLQNVKISKTSDTTLFELDGTHKIYRRLIRFRHFIHHN